MIASTLTNESFIMKHRIFIFLMFFCGSVFALDNRHTYPGKASETSSKIQTKNLKYPGYCEIEIINESYDDVIVRGIFDDGVPLRPFFIYAYEYPSYIDLYYDGYCHYGMDLFISTTDGYLIYSGYTTNGKTLHIVPYLMSGKPKFKIESK